MGAGLNCSKLMMSERAMSDLWPRCQGCVQEKCNSSAPLASAQLGQALLPDLTQPDLDLEALRDVARAVLGWLQLAEVAGK